MLYLLKNPPQIHLARFVPIYGIAGEEVGDDCCSSNDICPAGRMYPMNAAAIIANRRIIPMFHVSRKVYVP